MIIGARTIFVGRIRLPIQDRLSRELSTSPYRSGHTATETQRVILACEAIFEKGESGCAELRDVLHRYPAKC